MIENAITFSKDEAKKFKDILAEEAFGSASWSRNDIDDIRLAIKHYYIEQQGYRCCYCQKEILWDHGRVWDVEHVISRDQNPKFMFVPENLAVSCVECNGAKRTVRVTTKDYVRFPKRSACYLIVHPHFDDYSEHIDIVGENTYQALSKKGKFTIYHCDLLRYWEREAKIRKPIRDRRFERDIGELRFAKTLADAAPILASIQAILGLQEAGAAPAAAPPARPEDEAEADHGDDDQR